MNRRFSQSRRALLLVAALPFASLAQPARKTQNVILVMTDGLRWQEVFRGADAALMIKENDVGDPDALKKTYWRDTPQARREALMPFLWRTIAAGGQIYGNRDRHSEAYVTNGHNFSYPGYSETLCGFADPRIDSNKNIPNPTVTVLEWLNRRPAFRGKVAAFGAWSVIASAANGARGGFVANAGYDPLLAPPVTPEIALLNRVKADTRIWDDEPFDSFPFHTAMQYVKLHRPRVLFLSLGETDEWAHAGNYEEYLRSARRVDQFIEELWKTVQSMPQYRGTTTLIFLADHGRGEAPVEWKSHGEKIPDSKYIWMAMLGPDTAAQGERANVPAVTQSQVAATLAALLGEDYAAAVPNAGRPVADVLPR